MNSHSNLGARKKGSSSRRSIRPKLDILEDRLPPGDALLGAMFAGLLLEPAPSWPDREVDPPALPATNGPAGTSPNARASERSPAFPRVFLEWQSSFENPLAGGADSSTWLSDEQAPLDERVQRSGETRPVNRAMPAVGQGASPAPEAQAAVQATAPLAPQPMITALAPQPDLQGPAHQANEGLLDAVLSLSPQGKTVSAPYETAGKRETRQPVTPPLEGAASQPGQQQAPSGYRLTWFPQKFGSNRPPLPPPQPPLTRSHLRVPYQFIARLYTEALGRIPEQTAWRDWVTFFTPVGSCNITTLNQFGQQVYFSSEYEALYRTNPGFTPPTYDNAARLMTLYRGILGREPDYAGFTESSPSKATLLRARRVEEIMRTPGTAAEREFLRKRAVAAVRESQSPSTVARVLGVHRVSVPRWLRQAQVPGGSRCPAGSPCLRPRG